VVILLSGINVALEGSGRHCHVTRETLDTLFGKGFELEPVKDLSQPGQFTTPHRITVVGPRKSVDLMIIGPCRKGDQIELSFTDSRSLGFDPPPPIRDSGDLADSPGCKLIGPKGEVDTKEGVIIAKRHLHMTLEDGEKYGISDGQIVKVKIGGERALIFDEVLARVKSNAATYVHVDYDEFNAAAISHSNCYGEVIK